MGYTINRLPDLSALLVEWDSEFSFETDYETYNAELHTSLDGETNPVYLIINLRDLKMTFNDIMTGIRLGVKGENSAVNHPKLHKAVVVTRNRAMRMSAKGLNTVSFGNLDLPVFETLDEAIGYIREKAS